MDTFLAVLKFLAIFSAGIWGAIGLRVQYRDDAGRPTWWGRLALLGVVLSTVIAATAQGVETFKQKQAAEKEAERSREDDRKTQNLLFEIKKAVYPLDNIFINATASVPLQHSALNRYAQGVHRVTRPLLAREGGWDSTSCVTLPLATNKGRGCKTSEPPDRNTRLSLVRKQERQQPSARRLG